MTGSLMSSQIFQTRNAPWVSRAEDCCICYLLGEIMNRHHLAPGFYDIEEFRYQEETGPGLPLVLKPKEVQPGNLRMLCFSNAFSRASLRYPHMIVTRLEPQNAYGRSRLGKRHFQELDLDKIRAWVKSCEETHLETCCLGGPSHSPLRNLQLIDCQQNIVVCAPANCRYVALSYVWGHSDAPVNGLERWDDVPATIRHSIRLTRMLGFQYLWVDRYVCQFSANLC
jgi:hypothetical protein